MVAYIVGMIAGTICLVAPLIYAMDLNHCVARIMSRNPDFDPSKFTAYAPQGMLYVIAVIGAFVLVLSAVMTALTGFAHLKPKRQESESMLPPSGERTLPGS